jgi:hypothetical protein
MPVWYYGTTNDSVILAACNGRSYFRRRLAPGRHDNLYFWIKWLYANLHCVHPVKATMCQPSASAGRNLSQKEKVLSTADPIKGAARALALDHRLGGWVPYENVTTADEQSLRLRHSLVLKVRSVVYYCRQCYIEFIRCRSHDGTDSDQFDKIEISEA